MGGAVQFYMSNSQVLGVITNRRHLCLSARCASGLRCLIAVLALLGIHLAIERTGGDAQYF